MCASYKGCLFGVNSRPLIGNDGCFLVASWMLPYAAASIQYRDVTTGATGATEVAPKF